MESLIIAGTEDTPSVCFEPGNSKYEIGGRSLPEDAASFYEPLIDWFGKLGGEQPTGDLKFLMKLEYFNTASSKMILDLFNKLESLKEEGKNVTIEWHYPDGDDDMIEAGEEYSELVDIPFSFIAY